MSETTTLYTVHLEIQVDVEVDADLQPNPDFQRGFYDFHTQEDLVKHIAFCYVMGMTHMDGLAADQCRQIRSLDKEVKVVAIDNHG